MQAKIIYFKVKICSVFSDKSMRHLLYLYNYFPKLSTMISGRMGSDDDLMRRLRPIETMKEYAALVYAAPYACYLAHRHLFNLPIVWHHDIIDDTANALRPIFEYLNLPLELIEDAVNCKQLDSQANTQLSRETLKNVKVTAMTDDEKRRVDRIAKAMNLPISTFY